ncbi:MAG: hypothetical protein ACRESJ_05490, partial [Pseudomonas sp.]|uniref:hypothetical protein n=1 Tax=Pseudomonas sp. TaxID=306 RepID=UPI003D6E7CAB
WLEHHLDMVGVVGSSPIAPTKQNPLCWAVWKGSPKGGPFFVARVLGKLWEYFGQTLAQHLRMEWPNAKFTGT